MLFDPKKDFTDIKYPQVFQKDNPLEDPELQKYAALLLTVNHDDPLRLIRYVMACYDKKSPLARSISNLTLRRNEAALVAGYDLQEDAEILKTFFEFEDEGLQHVAIEFLKDQNDMYWAMVVSNEQTFWEYQQALNTRITVFKDEKQKLDALNVKTKLMDECDRITERVDVYRLKIFGDSETSDKSKKIKDFTPESIANKKNV